jgi:NAD(P)-dependent dehydrogenase (short-subunit alcohol dehydrogenase family)
VDHEELQMIELEGKVAFVTGGTSGIGLGIARALHAAGMKVVIASRQSKHLESALRAFPGKHDTVHAMQLDVTDRDAMAGAVEEVIRVFGKVHVLCNNAGVGVLASVARASFRDWDWALSVNVGGVVNGIQAFVPRILEQGEGGHIVSTASMGGLFLGGTAGVYCTTKYAVVGMMESLRAELAPYGVGASVYCPGLVNTNFHESEEGRPAQYAEEGRIVDPEMKQRIKDEIMARGMDPLEAGQRVLEGIRSNQLYIISHPEYGQGLRERFDAILASVPAEVEVPAERERVERALMLLSHKVYSDELKRLHESRANGHASAN